jgi:hypothetical protein
MELAWSGSEPFPLWSHIMLVRSPFKLLLSVAALASLGGCVAESGKTDTLIVQQAAKQPPAKTKTPTDTPATGSGTMHLRNPSYDSVTVEVRLGANSDCAQNASFGTRQLRKGDTWTITTDQAVCWRRDANPAAPTGAWSAWNRQAVSKGTTHEATL